MNITLPANFALVRTEIILNVNTPFNQRIYESDAVLKHTLSLLYVVNIAELLLGGYITELAFQPNE